MKDRYTISRRSFIKNMSIVSGGLILACNVPGDKKEIGHLTENLKGFNPNLFVHLKSNGDLVLTASRSEMGQGVRTSLTSVIADEMDADWNKVSVKQATGDDAYGNQNTDGSRSIRTIYEPMRQMGAMARSMLITAAANKWEIDESNCKTENHYVINSNNNDKLFYGDLVEAAAELEIPKDVVLKSPDDFIYIGKGLKSVDVHDFTHGKAKYGLDIRLPNMKYAAIARCPVTFGTVKSFNKEKALKVSGVVDIIEIPRIKKAFGPLGGVAVIANNTWAALQGKEALEIIWDYGENVEYTSDTYMEKITKNVHKKGKEIKNDGNVNKAFKKANKIIESTFQMPHLVHSPMEVPNATAYVQNDKCEVWAPVQAPQSTRKEVSDYLNTDIENITI